MTDRPPDLRDRLRRLERAMPAAVPVEPGSRARRPRPNRRVVVIAAVALLAGAILGAGAMRLLGPATTSRGESPAAPEGIYRSARPMSGSICAAVLMPMDHAFADLAWTRVWWWPTDGDDCGRRTDFVYVQWVRPERVRLAGPANGTRPGISLSLEVEVRSGDRYAFSFTLDPDDATITGTLPTYADSSGQVAGVPFLSLASFDDLQEVP